ncbi:MULTISPECIES: hypothetical protein [unclassified Brucella]|uniref:hypothetical protein n=1 Tax=unclassified Brucella TaxID=2632610 RepID=UPI00217D62B9|nr:MULTISPECIES: hypothetical protein [unclassified Brucella]UWF68577.1 hypothetical protein NYO63_12585 [Brucella sp. 1315]UWF71697.1 hypothetical protein NYO65_12580 [Brucella sp. 2594]
MEQELGEIADFEVIPEEIYQYLIDRSRKVSLDTAMTVSEHREIVKRERAERKQLGLSL